MDVFSSIISFSYNYFLILFLGAAVAGILIVLQTSGFASVSPLVIPTEVYYSWKERADARGCSIEQWLIYKVGVNDPPSDVAG